MSSHGCASVFASKFSFFFAGLGIKLRGLHMRSKCFATLPHSQPFLWLHFETGSCQVVQTGLELTVPPASASQEAGIIDIHCTTAASSKFSPLQGYQLYWIKSHSHDLRLILLNLQRPCFQRRSPSQVLEARTSTHLPVCVQWGRNQTIAAGRGSEGQVHRAGACHFSPICTSSLGTYGPSTCRAQSYLQTLLQGSCSLTAFLPHSAAPLIWVPASTVGPFGPPCGAQWAACPLEALNPAP